MDPNTIQLPQEIKDAGKRARDLTYQASSAQAAEPTITDVLRGKVSELYANNQDVVGNLDTTRASYLASPATARDKYQDVFNPFTRESLVSKYVNTAATPMLAASDLYGQRIGRIDDTIGAGTRAYQADTARKVAEAQMAGGTYEDMLNEFKLLDDMRSRQEELNLKKKGSGSGGDMFSDPVLGPILMAALGLGGTTGSNANTPSEQKPELSDQQRMDIARNPNVSWRSPGGQWIYDAESGDFVPIID